MCSYKNCPGAHSISSCSIRAKCKQPLVTYPEVRVADCHPIMTYDAPVCKCTIVITTELRFGTFTCQHCEVLAVYAGKSYMLTLTQRRKDY